MIFDKFNKHKPIVGGVVALIIVVVTITACLMIGRKLLDDQKAGQSPNTAESQNDNEAVSVDLKIKGNRKSKIFHLEGCPNYGDISEKNLVWFKTVEEAENAGYRQARNC